MTTRVRRPQARGEARRDKILRAALREIGKRGPGAVTHRIVAQAAKVPVGSTTYYFATKDDLLREALMLFVTEEVDRMESLENELLASAAEPQEIVERVLEVIGGAEPQNIAQFDLYLEAARRPGLRAAVQRCFEAYERVTALALGAMNVPEPEKVACHFVALSDGMAMRRLVTGGPGDEVVEQGILALFAGVLAAAAGNDPRGGDETTPR